jgi:hypothetical protein
MSSNLIQQAIFSINPITGVPYPADSLQVADGEGARRWQDVFQTISSQSATIGAGIGYLPSTFNRIYGIASSISTIIATSYSTLSTQIGEGGIPGSITTYQLQSTVTWVQTQSKYVSTADLVSSMTPFLNGSMSFMSNIQSTVVGLGTARYVSTATLQSTAVGINSHRVSTVTGLGSIGYISSLSLQSTVQNLGLASYISSSALMSTVTGLLYPATTAGGSLGVVVTGSSDPPYINLNTAVNTYLGTNNYFNQSNANSYGLVYGISLPSTTLGLISSLGTIGYVSTATLQSTSHGIQAAKQNIFIDRSGAMNIFNSVVSISSVAAITFLSSFVESSIIYKGQNGLMQGTVTNNSNLSFSTANLQLDVFSSLITPSSRIIFELHPTIQFDSLTTGAITSASYPMTTYLQYGNTWLSTTHQTQVAGSFAQNGYSNFFQRSIKMSVPGSSILGNYQHPYVLYHTLPGAISYQTNIGFRSQGMNAFFASTNSYFLSVQNLSF